jgi:transposase
MLETCGSAGKGNAIRGYASTAAKHGIAVFTAIRDALTGNPWIPPIPASA